MSTTIDPLVAAGLTKRERLTVATFYRAVGEGRPELLDDAVSTDWQDIPLAPHQARVAGAKPLIADFAAAFPALRTTIHEFIGSPGRAAVRGEMTSTPAGAWFGIPPTGKPFQVTNHKFHAIENGRLTCAWHLEDWFGWFHQVGAWPLATDHQEKEAA